MFVESRHTFNLVSANIKNLREKAGCNTLNKCDTLESWKQEVVSIASSYRTIFSCRDNASWFLKPLLKLMIWWKLGDLSGYGVITNLKVIATYESISKVHYKVNDLVNKYRVDISANGHKPPETPGYFTLLGMQASINRIQQSQSEPGFQPDGGALTPSAPPGEEASSVARGISVSSVERALAGDQKIELYALNSKDRKIMQSDVAGLGSGLLDHSFNTGRVRIFIYGGAGDFEGKYACEGQMNHQQVTDNLVQQYNNTLQSDTPELDIKKGLFEAGHSWIQWYFPILTRSSVLTLAEDSVLDQQGFMHLRQKPLIKKTIFCNALIFAKFLGFDYYPASNTFKAVDRTKNQKDAFWKNALYPDPSTDDNHNWKRICRVIESLRHMGLGELATSLHEAITTKIRGSELQDSEGLQSSMNEYWHNALKNNDVPSSQGDIDFNTVRAMIFAEPEEVVSA